MWRNSNLNWNEPWNSGTDRQLQHSFFTQNAKLLLLLAVAVSLKSLMLSSLAVSEAAVFLVAHSKELLFGMTSSVMVPVFLLFRLVHRLAVPAFYLGTVLPYWLVKIVTLLRKICNRWVQCGLSSQRPLFVVSEHLNIAWVFKSRVLNVWARFLLAI